MKKTLITLLALGSMSMASYTPVNYIQYDLAFNGQSTTTTLSGSDAGIFKYNSGEYPVIKNWIMDFQITDVNMPVSTTKIFWKAQGGYGGLEMYLKTDATGALTMGLSDRNGTVLIGNTVAFDWDTNNKQPLTIRVGYHYETGNTYVTNMTTGDFAEGQTGMNKDYAQLGGILQAAGYTSDNTLTMKLGTAYDMTNSINAKAFKGYATSTTDSPTVPEPTTATLSLLALAGLAARRRRK